MLFRRPFLDGIRKGTVTLAFRRWRRPTVRAGGTLLTPLGEVQIGSVSRIALKDISAKDARRAGFDSREALVVELERRSDGDFYRIELGPLRPDRRVALRKTRIGSDAEFGDLRKRLERLDARAEDGPWTRAVLEAIREHPGVRAGDVCESVDQEKTRFKTNVRKLKALGLTESLETGYRLSPRGLALLDRLRSG